MNEIALTNSTIHWHLEVNACELWVVLAKQEAMKVALEQGEADLALAKAQEANHTACTAPAQVATKSSKAPVQSASLPLTTTKPKAPSFIEEVCPMEPCPPIPVYPAASAKAGPSCPCPCHQPPFPFLQFFSWGV